MSHKFFLNSFGSNPNSLSKRQRPSFAINAKVTLYSLSKGRGRCLPRQAVGQVIKTFLPTIDAVEISVLSIYLYFETANIVTKICLHHWPGIMGRLYEALSVRAHFDNFDISIWTTYTSFFHFSSRVIFQVCSNGVFG